QTAALRARLSATSRVRAVAANTNQCLTHGLTSGVHSTHEEIETRGYDLKAVNPHAKNNEDTRTTKELLDLIEALIEAKGQEVTEALASSRRQHKQILS